MLMNENFGNIEKFLKSFSTNFEKKLLSFLPKTLFFSDRLDKAMRYVVKVGGKRIRPLILSEISSILGVKKENSDRVAASIEFIHCYSLVHDDLPSMDNDDLRRGSPTCHVQFDEATAILAGDALQPLAFELICKINVQENIKVLLLSKLAKACGFSGMVGGQVKDINMDEKVTIEELDLMHFQKTGRLIQTSLEIGGHLSQLEEETIELLGNYGEKIGLAFQIQDDIIDIESPALVSGKNQGSDLNQNKITYPSMVGLEGAKSKANQLAEEAKEILVPLSQKADNLRMLADYVVSRNS